METSQPAAMTSLRLELRAREAAKFTISPTRLLHAALHRSLERVDAALSARVHAAEVNSFTLSPLFFADERGRHVQAVSAGERLLVQLCTLDRETLSGLLTALTWHWREEQPLALDWQPFTVEAIAPGNLIAPASPPLLTYAQLWAMTAPESELSLRFVSPVVFRNKGTSLPPSDPWRLFQSYLRRWERFSDVPIHGIDEATVRAGVTLRVVDRLEVRSFQLGIVAQPGFLGAVHCAVGGDEVFRRGISALANYAMYSGTGAKTAFGMGQTERLT